MQRPDLKPQLSALPAKPGVYLYYDAGGTVIYVGKAVSLRSRVRSYFQDSARLETKTRRLVEKIDRIEWLVTGSELEALLLEMNLIKSHRPHYNIVLKDDKRYPYIKVTWREAFPKVFPTRQLVDDGSRYFGPFASAAAMRDSVDTLRRVFPFLDCDRTITGRDARACLFLDLGLCLGPCVGAVDKAGYRQMIDGLCKFLGGDTKPVLAGLRDEMQAHSENLEFEQAARVRDRLAALEKLIERQRIISPSLADQDVIALAREDGSAIAQIFFVRNGKLIGREYFRLDGTEGEDEATILGQFIQQFYESSGTVPGEIVVPEQVAESEIIHRWLEGKRGTKVKLSVPKRGHKKALVDVAIENAAETLRALKAAHAVEDAPDAAELAVEELQTALGLPSPPRRIECFDISNLQGTHTVGSMIVFEDAKPLKADYRHFKIKTVAGGDDYAAMTEMLTRRFTRLAASRAEMREGAQDGLAQLAEGGAAPPAGADSGWYEASRPAKASHRAPIASDLASGASASNPYEGSAGPMSHAEVISLGRKSTAADGGAFSRAPDLVLVDGGKGQLGAAAAVLQRLGLDDLPLASLAKREEEVFRPGQSDPIVLARSSPALFLVQRARDEAHRFAISFNRQLRQQAGMRSSLDDVPGIGGKRRRALLVAFGSVAGIRAASLDDLAAVPGMTRRVAEQVKAFL